MVFAISVISSDPALISLCVCGCLSCRRHFGDFRRLGDFGRFGDFRRFGDFPGKSHTWTNASVGGKF